MSNLHIASHPLIQHKLSLMRCQTTSAAEFRRLLFEITLLLAYLVTQDLELDLIPIKTPLQRMQAPQLKDKSPCLVSILRAGNGMVEAMLTLMPFASLAHIGIYRDPQSLQPVEYYFKAPEDLGSRLVILLDPMLATGQSANAAIHLLKQTGAKNIRMVSLLAAPQGIEYLQNHHPDIHLYLAAIDKTLDEKGYILPGLGDAGDRLYKS